MYLMPGNLHQGLPAVVAVDYLDHLHLVPDGSFSSFFFASAGNISWIST